MAISSNAQIIQVLKGSDIVATYTADEADKVIFKSNIPDGVIGGVFSVSNNRKVYFSSGNLYRSNGNYYIENKQNGYSVSGKIFDITHLNFIYWTAATDGTTELTGDVQEILFTNANDSTANPLFTVNGITGKFRALSNNEWNYILNQREMKNDKDRYKFITITDGEGEEEKTYSGLCLYPDNYDGNYDESTMEEINSAKIAFLPAAGYASGGNMRSVESYGFYWSSNCSTYSDSYYLQFGATSVSVPAFSRNYGFCIRLVYDIAS